MCFSCKRQTLLKEQTCDDEREKVKKKSSLKHGIPLVFSFVYLKIGNRLSSGWVVAWAMDSLGSGRQPVVRISFSSSCPTWAENPWAVIWKNPTLNKRWLSQYELSRHPSRERKTDENYFIWGHYFATKGEFLSYRICLVCIPCQIKMKTCKRCQCRGTVHYIIDFEFRDVRPTVCLLCFE